MIRFIDPTTGNVYDGHAPYIHWFDGKQSVGLNYDKRFLILTDADKIEIVLNSEVFFLANDHKLPNRSLSMEDIEDPVVKEFYEKKYLDLDLFKTNHLYHLPIEAAKVGNYYIFNFNILACGKYVGEVTDTFTINGEEFTVGADFIDENEALGTNLTNFGVELSNEVQRAIYEKNINEQKVDWVLINRKFKELLNEYINVIGNKGSYKSLINSLKWFEYGELVTIYEYWRHPEPNHDYLSRKDLTQFITTESEDLLYTMQKTTFNGISCALEKIMTDPDGTTKYEDYYIERARNNKLVDEPNPKLEEVSMLWSKKEMQLKMTLLGNFFATYFMPIHLDLIHSTVEDIVYAQTIKSTALPKWERVDIHDEINTFRCELNKVYHLSNVETFTNPKTPFGFIHSSNFNEEDEALHILGVDMELNREEEKLDQLKTYALQHFKGIGAIIPFNCILENVIGSASITSSYIRIYKGRKETIHGEEKIVWELKEERGTENINHKQKDNLVKIDFNLLIQQTGIYKVQLEFRRSDGVLYIRTFDFVVDDETYPTLKMYRLVPKDDFNLDAQHLNRWMTEANEEDNPIKFGNIADYVLNPVQLHSVIQDSTISESPASYMQFISAATKKIGNYEKDTRVHTNQVIIISMKTPGDSYREPIISFRDKNNHANYKSWKYLESNGFVWFERKVETGGPQGPRYVYGHVRYDSLIEPSDPDVLVEMTPTKKRFFIGINKNPNIEGKVIKWEYDPEHSDNSDTDFETKVWIRDMFIPYFYKLEEIGQTSLAEQVLEDLTPEELFKRNCESKTYEINQSDVVCFLPSIKCIRRPNSFMWKYICTSTDEEITPIKYRDLEAEIVYDETGKALKIKENDNRITNHNPFPTILQPLLGRYDFRVLPSAGYYDIVLNYKLDDDTEDNRTKTVSSQLLIRRKEKYERSVALPSGTDTRPSGVAQSVFADTGISILNGTNTTHIFR